MSDIVNTPLSDPFPKPKKPALDTSLQNTPEFAAALAKRAADYPAAFKKHLARLRGEALDSEA